MYIDGIISLTKLYYSLHIFFTASKFLCKDLVKWFEQ